MLQLYKKNMQIYILSNMKEICTKYALNMRKYARNCTKYAGVCQ